MTVRFFSIIFGIFLSLSANAGGVKGRVIDDEGKPLSFTTIYVKQTGSGSITNTAGEYELRLDPGTYTIVFQYLGYQTQQIDVEVAGKTLVRDVVMGKQAYMLAEAQIKGGNEDPAYKIIRKAIAKSGFHRQQLDAYTCEVYMKGGGRLVEVPWYLRKALEKEGVDTSASFVSETISKISYVRPSTFSEEVISIRTIGDDRNSSPMRFIGASFYEPIVAEGLISPLSTKAFAYYKFRYISTFTDREYQISKIEVIPRSKGEDVVAGVIYIVDDLWCIHSFDFNMIVQGISLQLKQVFAPVVENVWLPVTHRYDGTGKFIGIRFEFNYLATVGNYDVKLNPALSSEIVVYDEKTEKHLIDARKVKAPETELKELSTAEKKLAEGDEITHKELRQMMKSYERDERKKNTESEVVEIRSLKIDTLAFKSDSSYWAERRPIPLTGREVKGYKLQDSLSVEAKKKEEGDTLGTGENKFKFDQLLFGHYYTIGKKDFIRIHSPWTMINFNTVDGWNAEYRVSYYRRFDAYHRLEIAPRIRYAFNRNKPLGELLAEYRYRNGLRRGNLALQGGWYYSQFNESVPIQPIFNTFSTLVTERNFMKIYDRNFVEARWNHNLNGAVKVGARVAFDERIETFNTTSQVFFPSKRIFTDNLPRNPGLPEEGFGESRIFKATVSAELKPGAKYMKSDDQYYSRNRPPVIGIRYTKAFPNVWGSSPDIDFMAISGKFDFKFTTLGRLNLRSEYGKFFRFNNGDFMDFAHFMGNEMYFTRLGSLNGYSLLPYYDKSTSRHYLSTYTIYEFRNLLLGNIRALRMLGVNERLIANHLYTPRDGHYFEVGYSISNLFRFARVDFVTSYYDSGFREFRIQVGFASDFINIE